MSGLETLIPLIGAGLSGAGTIAGGIAANEQAQFQAAQEEARGKEEFAAAQRDAMEKRREGQLVMSRQQALAASSGAGTTTPTIVKLMTDTGAQADYNARTAIYGGESRRAGLFDQARATRRSGRASLLGGFLGGFGQMGTGIYNSGAFSGLGKTDPWKGLR